MQLTKAIFDVKQVVGPNVNDSVISKALRNHAYSVPAAINEIVDLTCSGDIEEVKILPPASTKSSQKQSFEVIELLDDEESRSPVRSSRKPTVTVHESSSKRYREPPNFLSTMPSARFLTSTTSTWPKVLGRRSVDAESTCRGRPPPEMVPGAALIVKRLPSTSHKNCIIRLVTTKESEVGRIPSALATFLAPCMDAGIITCKAKVEFMPERLNIFTRFGVTIEFALASSTGFQCFERRAQDEDLMEKKKKSGASSTTTTTAAIKEDQDVSDDLWKVLQVAFGNLTVDGVFGGRLAEGAFSLLDDNPTTITTVNSNGIGEDDEKKPSEEELFGGKGAEDSLLPPDVGEEVTGLGLNVELRPHQKVAVNWMKQREQGLLASTTTANTQHHPLWTETKFEDGTSFYINRFTRMATIKPPPDVSRLCKGGILADEMGLGKTIVVLGRITQDINEKLGITVVDAGESGVDMKVKDVAEVETVTRNEDVPVKEEKESEEQSEDIHESIKRKRVKRSLSSGSTSPPATSSDEKGPGEDDENDFETDPPEGVKADLRPSNSKECGTLVIVVTSLLSQWEEEILSKVSPKQRGLFDQKFTTYVYYGSDREGAAKLRTSDVVLTTFGVVAAEHKSKNPALFGLNWRRIVLDEAQSVRNADTLQAKAVLDLKAERRWCLTGTPVQNGIDDLFQLFRFIRLEPWGQRIWWDRVIEKPYKAGNPAALQRIRSVLADGPVLLRRTHKSVEAMYPSEAGGAASLPKLTTEIVSIELTSAERAFYDSLYSRSKLEFDGMVASGKATTSYVTILSLLIRLRQAADHPFLVLGRPKGDKEEERKRDDEYIKRISAKYFSSTESQHSSLARSSSLPQEGASTSGTLEFARKTLKELARGEGDCTICLCAMTDPVMIKCAHSFCRECILPMATAGYYGGGQCPVCRESFTKQDLVDIRLPSKENQISLKDGSIVTDAEELLTGRFRSSSKLDRLVEEITKRRRQGTKDKFLVFSQFTQMLDLVQVALSKMDPPVEYQRLDGSLTASKRDQALKRYRENDDCEVLVMSLKAGCLGLNITCANVVVLLDPWWNAAVEHQAIGRAHRMGQKREVTVLRFIAADTVEVKMLSVQERKKMVASDTLGFEQFGAGGADEDDTKAVAKLTMDDLKEFFS